MDRESNWQKAKDKELFDTVFNNTEVEKIKDRIYPRRWYVDSRSHFKNINTSTEKAKKLLDDGATNNFQFRDVSHDDSVQIW